MPGRFCAAKLTRERLVARTMEYSRDNLERAFSIEAGRSLRLRAYAERARRENRLQLARLFRAAAEASAVQGLNHFWALFPVVEVEDDIDEAVSSAVDRSVETYPAMRDRARSEGYQAAEWALTYAVEVTRHHAALLEAAQASLQPEEVFPFFVCPTCGYIAEREPPGECPVCGTKGELFGCVD